MVAPATSVSRAVEARLSCRAFLPREVPVDVVREILAKAARAPSGGNTQPWHCHVVAGAKREQLVAAALRNFEEGNVGDKPEFQMYPAAKASKAYMERRRKLGYDMYSLMGIGKDDTAGRLEAMKANFSFFGAPVGIIVTVDRIVDKNGWGHVGMFIVRPPGAACGRGSAAA
jgi:nitroreductase